MRTNIDINDSLLKETTSVSRVNKKGLVAIAIEAQALLLNKKRDFEKIVEIRFITHKFFIYSRKFT